MLILCCIFVRHASGDAAQERPYTPKFNGDEHMLKLFLMNVRKSCLHLITAYLKISLRHWCDSIP